MKFQEKNCLIGDGFVISLSIASKIDKMIIIQRSVNHEKNYFNIANSFGNCYISWMRYCAKWYLRCNNLEGFLI